MIKALGRFKDPAAIKPLLDALKSSVAAVRAAAVDALVAIVKDKNGPAHDDVAAGVRGLLTDRRPTSATVQSPPRARSATGKPSPP